MRALKAFGKNDLLNIKRDSMLLYMAVVPWIMVGITRILLPIAGEWLAHNYQLRVEEYYSLIISFFFILQIPMIFGLIFGLMILDEKDDHVLTALKVTPLSLDSYLFYRFSATIVISIVYVFLTIFATGLIDTVILLRSMPAAFLSGLLAVFMMLIMVSFADNKLEGLAIMKASGILMIGPLAAFFIKNDWQILLGILPSYWPAKAFWSSVRGESIVSYIIIGLVYNLILCYLLYRRFRKKYFL